MNDPLRRTGYFFRTDDEIYFTPSEYSYFRKKEDLDSFVAWFDHVQESYILADLEPKEDKFRQEALSDKGTIQEVF